MRDEPKIPLMHETEPGYLAHSSLVVAMVYPVYPDQWQHLARCCFGEGRPTGNGEVKWTGDSHRYDIFYQEVGPGRTTSAAYAIRWRHGGGAGWIVFPANGRRHESNIVAHILNACEPRRWDYCHAICSMLEDHRADAAGNAEREIKTAFVEGRLKKRKIRGQDDYTVTITT